MEDILACANCGYETIDEDELGVDTCQSCGGEMCIDCDAGGTCVDCVGGQEE